MAEWVPKSAVPVDDDWVPPSARTPVKGHSRKPRIGAAVGGAAGGLVGKLGGPVGAVAGAGAGGAAGEAFQQGLEAAPPNIQGPVAQALQGLMSGGANAGEIARQGAEQAAFEAGGGLVGKGVKMAGRPLMQAALRATPEAAKTAIAAGATATKEGAKKILERIGDAGQVALRITREATARGVKYDQSAIARNLYSEMVGPMRGLPGDKARREYVKRLSLQFLGENPKAAMTPTQLHLAKQRADALAAPLYKVLNVGGRLTDREDVALRWYKKFADQARELLEPQELLPGYKDVNDVTKSLIEVKDALSPAARNGMSFPQRVLERGTLPAAGAAVGGAAGATRGETGQERSMNFAAGAALGAGLSTPQALSWMAIQAQNPILASILANLFRGGRLATQAGDEQ